jgi:hypothetical protein
MVPAGYPGHVEGPAENPQRYAFGNMPGLGRQPRPVSNIPQPGSQLGGQFRDIVPNGYAPGGETYGRNPYAGVNDTISSLGRNAGEIQESTNRAARAFSPDDLEGIQDRYQKGREAGGTFGNRLAKNAARDLVGGYFGAQQAGGESDVASDIKGAGMDHPSVLPDRQAPGSNLSIRQFGRLAEDLGEEAV